MSRIGKSFGPVRALEDVSLEVRPGEVLALLGENGAGKSTLMKILSGVWPEGSYDGSFELQGQSMRFRDTRQAFSAGIAMIHQELAVFPELTVAEHLELTELPNFIRWDDLNRRVAAFLSRIDFDRLGLAPETKVGTLSVGGRQLVEIARALYRDAKVIVFDEPTSALTEPEVQVLYGVIERLRKEGRGILYISHRLDEVFRLADRVVILRDGRFVAEAPMAARAELEPQIIQWMVGRPLGELYPAKNTQFGAEILRVEDLTIQSPEGKILADQVSFRVRAGEVLALGGLLGAGRTETLEALFGAFHPSGPRKPGYRIRGRLWIKGQEVKVRRPLGAITLRMALVSEDRKQSGLVLKHSIRQNLSLPGLVSGRVNLRDEGTGIAHWWRELRIRARDPEQGVSELSGGHQQKIVLAKWLLTNPEILFLDEPTRGVDVGAKHEIYTWIQKLANQGMAIVLASSEMPELLGLAHSILVLREGKISGRFATGQAVTQEEIMKAASL